jgi:hypothetical protein
MDLLAKLFCVLFFVWLVAMAVGLLIALMPVILFVIGFFLMIGFLTLLVRLLGF